MLSRMIAIALGIVAVAFFPTLPAPFSSTTAVDVALLAALGLLTIRWLYWSLPVALLLGVAWGVHCGHGLVNSLLPEHWQGQDVWVVGTVEGLPVQYQQHGSSVQRFDLRLEEPVCRAVTSSEQFEQLPVTCQSLRRLRLSWYSSGDTQIEKIIPGQRWRLQVRAKRPHGMANPGGFDYQSWLLQQGFGAVGYVRNNMANQRLADARYSIDRLRWQGAVYLDRQLAGRTHRAVLKALLLGDKRDIEPEQWDMYARTGLTHLLVISGLHVGLVSMLAFFCGRLTSLLINPNGAAERCGALLAIFVAFSYSAAAGFSLPTQRALVMVVVLMLSLLLRRNLAPGQAIVTALLVCLLWDPLAPVSLSFWMSFAAVAVLCYGSCGRREGADTSRRKLGASQYLVFIGLLPVLAILLGQISLLSPLVNLFAVPLFSVLIVPCNMLAALLAVVHDEAALWLWQWLDWLLVMFFDTVAALDRSAGGSVLYIPGQSVASKILAVLAALILLLPKGFPLRYLGWLLLLPMLLTRPQPPAAGDVYLTVLDVGQGLSVVVQTANHTLVYDVGPSMGDNFSTATAALLPYLRHRAIDRLDALVLSHADNDHAGGWASLVSALPVHSLLLGEAVLPGRSIGVKDKVEERQSAAQTIEQPLPNSVGLSTVVSSRSAPVTENTPGKPCYAGQQWQWDGVQFAFLHPLDGRDYRSANNRSCVLKITAGDSSFLLAGDIERPVERQLLHRERGSGRLRSTVLIAPHHGSSTSSTWPFIRAVNPQHVVFASGYRNRFHHPKPEVVERYRHHQCTLHNTSENGAVSFRVRAGKLLPVQHYRQRISRYWH